MGYLSEIEVASAIALIENGVNIRQVARNFNHSPSVIKRVYDCDRQNGQYKRQAEQS